MAKLLSVLALACLLGLPSLPAQTTPAVKPVDAAPRGRAYPWKRNILTTMFYVGEGGTTVSATTQDNSAWVKDWPGAYGGHDRPEGRAGLAPKTFAPTLNIFYVALPFNDVAFPDLARRWCPWWHEPAPGQRYVSQCKGRWVEIRSRNGKSCFATWEDVGPLEVDSAEYVFGNARPTSRHSGAGLDVSPAVQQYLDMASSEVMDWRFVDYPPDGPWIEYGEKAILFSALKSQDRQQKNKPVSPVSVPLAPGPMEASDVSGRKAKASKS